MTWYVRKGHGARIRLRAEYDSAELWAEYRAAIEGAPKPGKSPAAHTLAWALDRYRHSSAWGALSVATRKQSEAIYRSVVKSAGNVPLRDVTMETIKEGRERRKDRPHAANDFLKAMRRLFRWAADRDGGNLLTTNPTLGVKILKGGNDDQGFHTWTPDEMQRFEDYWPIGTKERLAFDLLRYTGFARGDVVRLGRQHVKDGVITFRMEKKRGVGVVYPPLLPVLAETISASKTGDLTYLVGEDGTPYTKESFGNWFREACVKAGCPGRAHGLRKAAATRCAEKGVPLPQIMALFGWGTEKMALHYIRKANRKLLAAQAAAALAPTQTENENRPHLGSGAGDNGKKQAISGG